MQDDRWEYRVWLPDAGDLSRRIADAARFELESETRTDHYFLTAEDRLLAKIRGGETFEIKELLETRSGCEHWMMAVSNRFPPGTRSLDRLVGEARDVPAAAALIAAAGQSIAILEVKKARRRFALGASGAEAEVTAVTHHGRTHHTVAVEVPDFETCAAIVQSLGMDSLENIDYGSFLRGKIG